MKKIIAFLVIALTLNVAFSQSTVSVSGYVKDNSPGNGLPLANYRVVSWHAERSYPYTDKTFYVTTDLFDTTYTDQNGNYSFTWTVSNIENSIPEFRIDVATIDLISGIVAIIHKGKYTNFPVGATNTRNFISINPVSTEFNTDTVAIIDSTNVSIQNLDVSKTFLSNNILSISTHNMSIVSIYNVSGQLVYQETTKENSLIDLSDLKSGLYFARIKEGVNENTIKFIK